MMNSVETALVEMAEKVNQVYFSEIPKLDLTQISTDLFYRKFGASNPERYSNPFYDHMIRQKLSPYSFKMSHSLDYEAIKPIFTIDRMGE